MHEFTVSSILPMITIDKASDTPEMKALKSIKRLIVFVSAWFRTTKSPSIKIKFASANNFNCSLMCWVLKDVTSNFFEVLFLNIGNRNKRRQICIRSIKQIKHLVHIRHNVFIVRKIQRL